MVRRNELVAYLDTLLASGSFRDSCPNGLQVEGRAQIHRLVTGVTANLALLREAQERNADAVLVHHGYFWKGEAPTVVGMKQRRLKQLLAADISLLAYHLPLDAHPVYGNNAQLARLLELCPDGGLEEGDTAIGMVGHLASPMSAAEFAGVVEERLQRAPFHVAAGPPLINTIAWCSGGAQSLIGCAVERGVDAYLTGEVSEPTVHIARECGIHFFAAGHHATERYGVQALGEHLAQRFGVEHHFVDIDNPV